MLYGAAEHVLSHECKEPHFRVTCADVADSVVRRKDNIVALQFLLPFSQPRPDSINLNLGLYPCHTLVDPTSSCYYLVVSSDLVDVLGRFSSAQSVFSIADSRVLTPDLAAANQRSAIAALLSNHSR